MVRRIKKFSTLYPIFILLSSHINKNSILKKENNKIKENQNSKRRIERCKECCILAAENINLCVPISCKRYFYFYF